MRSARATLSVAPGAALSDQETIAAYERLAREYDHSEHRTTRELERLSVAALDAAGLRETFANREPKIVELGCGSGALSAQVFQQVYRGFLMLTDPAPRMLARAIERIADPEAESALATMQVVGSAMEIIERLAAPPDAILAGLADPYLSPLLVRAIARKAGSETLVFVTLPSLAWAAPERGERLRIPIDRTRFRTKEGGVVHARSLALDAPELIKLFEAGGMRVLAEGSLRSEDRSFEPRPEISWVLAKPRLAAMPGP